MKVTVKRSVIELVEGDITSENVDAIVNAANPTLLGGGGVDGAIHRAGGPQILEACKEVRRSAHPEGLPTGQAAVTTGGRLKARFVIHTVGPVFQGGGSNEEALLTDAHRNSLVLADEQGLRSVAFPAISTGVYGYPLDEAARVALTTVKAYLEGETGIELVRFVLFGDKAHKAFEEALRTLRRLG